MLLAYFQMRWEIPSSWACGCSAKMQNNTCSPKDLREYFLQKLRSQKFEDYRASAEDDFQHLLTPWLIRQDLSRLNYTCPQFIWGTYRTWIFFDSVSVSLWCLDTAFSLILQRSWRVEGEASLIAMIFSFFFFRLFGILYKREFCKPITLDIWSCINFSFGRLPHAL